VGVSYFSKSSFLHPDDSEKQLIIDEIRELVETAIFPLMQRRKIYPSSSLGIAIGRLRRMPEYRQVWNDPLSLVATTTHWGGAEGEHNAINAMCKMRPAAREGRSSDVLVVEQRKGQYEFQEVVLSSIARYFSSDFPWGDYPREGAVFSRTVRPEGRAWLVGVDATGSHHDGFIAGVIADYLFTHYPD